MPPRKSEWPGYVYSGMEVFLCRAFARAIRTTDTVASSDLKVLSQVAYAKGVAEHVSHAAALHLSVANLYPAGQSLSSSVASLAGTAQMFHDAQDAVC